MPTVSRAFFYQKAFAYKIKKGLSLKPSFVFLLSFLNWRRIQVKNFVNITNGFKREKMELNRFPREELAGKNKAK